MPLNCYKPLTEKNSTLTVLEYDFSSIAALDYPDVLLHGQGERSFFDIPEMNSQRGRRMEIVENLENVKEKIEKLLALSKSENENEAASALKKAHKLVKKYELEETARIFWRELYLRRVKKTIDKRQKKRV